MDAQQDNNISFEDLLEQEAHKDSEQIDFQKSIGQVKKIKQDKIATHTQSMDKELAKIKQIAASKDTKEENIDHLSSSFVPMVGPNEVLSYRSSGAQPYLLKKLKNGEYREADFIDLHGKTIEDAYEYTRQYIHYAREKGFRCVLIIHGKAQDQRYKQQATLKSYVAHWLRQMKDVIAFHSAPDWKGGTGALLVILKKGDKESYENKERHALRTR